MAEIHMKDLAHNVTFKAKIYGIEEYRMRARIGIFLIKIACWIMWAGIEVSFEKKDDG